MNIRFQDRMIKFPRRPLVMGILNLNTDSFSDANLSSNLKARAVKMVADGADILDIGAESARTDTVIISIEEEIKRFENFLIHWESLCRDTKPIDSEQIWPPILSLNTWRKAVLESLLKREVKIDLVNDMSALNDASHAEICAKAGASLLIMHNQGKIKQSQCHQNYESIWDSLKGFFDEKITIAEKMGLSSDQIVLDPGIDFAKQKQDNLSIYRELEKLTRYQKAILLPVSRKTVIDNVLDIKNPQDRDPATIACITIGVLKGANIFRVHNVRATWQLLKTLTAIEQSSEQIKSAN